MEQTRLGHANGRARYYPRFSADEFDRRYAAVRGMMDDRDIDALVLYGNAGDHQPNVYYLTNYRPAFETYLVFFADPAEATTLFVGISNHLQYVREVSEAEDLRLMLPDPGRNVADRLGEAGVDAGRIGLVGGDPRYRHTLPYDHYRTLEAELAAELVDATVEYLLLTSERSEEEIDLVREAAALVDRGMEAIETTAAPGTTELDLGRTLQRLYLDGGGEVRYSWISSAPMTGAEPGEPLPWKHPSARTIERGDVVTTEISAAVRGYKSQVHRPFAVGAAPTETYRDIYAVAEETYHGLLEAVRPGNTAADLHAALAPIEESGFKIYDVMFHGYGASYSHPFVGTRGSNYWPGAEDPLTANWTLSEGQVLVLQPNAFTPDETAGLQLGTTVVVRSDGPEVLQSYPVEFVEV